VSELPSASLLENARLNSLVFVPNALQGVFRRRRTAVGVATRANVDGHAVGLLRGMNRGHHGGPVWVRVVRDPALLLLAPADVHRALAGSPEPFASDPKPKRDGMVAFQPDALTISRGETWRKRREFNEAVLETGRPLHGLGDRFVAVAGEEAETLAIAAARDGGEIGWDDWGEAFRRITRRVVLGDASADDTELSAALAELMSEANGMPGKTSPRYPKLIARLGEYVAAAEPGSLVSRFAEAPADPETKPVGQIPHWMFATGDTLAINAFRALAAIAAHPRQRARVLAELGDADGLEVEHVFALSYLEGCLEEAMRLWPTTTMLSRETLAETEWGGAVVPAGTQVLIPNTFLHRDRDRHPWADEFAPQRWVSGEAAGDWSFNHFSRGPQGCPGAALALLLGKTVLGTLLRSGGVELVSPSMDPAKPLPHMLDFFSIRVRLS
jgi:cytochrome P450